MSDDIPAKPTLGFVGLGPIGAPLATRLLHAGFRVQIYDLDNDAVR